jgi:hypothetical protein
MCVQRENCQDSVFPGLNLVYSNEQVLWLNLFFAALEDNRESVCPKLLRDLRCAYELILDHRHSRLSVMEVARAIKEAASATPLAFSPGSSRGASPGGRYSRYGQSSGYHHSSSNPPEHDILLTFPDGVITVSAARNAIGRRDNKGSHADGTAAACCAFQ